MLSNKDRGSAKECAFFDAFTNRLEHINPKLKVNFSHVQAHKGNYWNEKVDTYAREARNNTVGLTADAIFCNRLEPKLVDSLKL